METDPNTPPLENNPQAGGSPPPLPPAPPPFVAPPPKPASTRKVLAFVLSLCLCLFIADALISLLDDSLILFANVLFLSPFRGLVGFLSVLLALVTYLLIGLTPMVPKRMFLPLTLFVPFAELVLIPFMIYWYGHIQLVVWFLSLLQVILGLGLLFWLGGFKWRWPLVPEDRLNGKGFSWPNLLGFITVNAFVFLPGVLVYLFVCASAAASHFSEGFLALRPSGITVQVRKYVRSDGKTVELYPMMHVAESDFYQKVVQSFPSNSVILMEGVTDDKNLLTNKITYKRMAKALGLGEQHQDFKPNPQEVIRADVDVDQFSTNTIALLNLAMLVHAKGLTPDAILLLLQEREEPGFEKQLFDDLLNKRNQHLLGVIREHLSKPGQIIVPWGAAHMPGLAKELQKSGFHLQEAQDYFAIRFHSGGKQESYVKLKGS